MKEKLTDTVFTTHSVAAIENGDTLCFLWRETSNVKCLPIRIHMNKKDRIKRIVTYSDKIIKDRPVKLNIYSRDFILDKEKSSSNTIVYKIKYTTYINQEIVGSYSGKYKVIRLDFRNRRIFYNTMNYYESLFGKANKYSFREYDKEICRDFAHFVCWECNQYKVSIKNEIMTNCTPSDEKNQILYITIYRAY